MTSELNCALLRGELRNPGRKLIELEREEDDDERDKGCGCGGDWEIVEWSNICFDSFLS